MIRLNCGGVSGLERHHMQDGITLFICIAAAILTVALVTLALFWA